MAGLVPRRGYPLPTLSHTKEDYYIDFPVVYNATVTEEPFYVDYPFTFVTSDATVTTLYKWNGSSWTEVSGINNPEYIYGRGFYAVTTSSAAYVTVTEHTHGETFEL